MGIFGERVQENSMEKEYSVQQMILRQVDITCKELSSTPTLHHTQNYSKCIKDLNTRTKTIFKNYEILRRKPIHKSS